MAKKRVSLLSALWRWVMEGLQAADPGPCPHCGARSGRKATGPERRRQALPSKRVKTERTRREAFDELRRLVEAGVPPSQLPEDLLIRAAGRR